MTKLPTDLSGKELVKILTKIGFVFQRQQGSHMVLRRESPLAWWFQTTEICASGLFEQFSTRLELQSSS